MFNQPILKQIVEKIKEYDTVIIARHQRPDGDCIGASLGLRALLRASFPAKEIYSVGKGKAEYLDFLGSEDVIDEEKYQNALIIVVDTANHERIDDDNYNKGAYLIKIDHHIITDNYADLSYVEEEAAASCCLIVKLWQANLDVLKMTDEAALALYAGIVTDTGRFRFSATDGESLELASMLLKYQINTEWLYAKLYLKDQEMLALQGEVMRKFKATENIAYVHITKAMQEKYNLTPEESANVVNMLDCLKGVLAWVAFVDQKDESIRVRLRSRFCPVNKVANNYRGGGHANASGATVYNKREMNKLLKELDNVVAEYKRGNTGWL